MYKYEESEFESISHPLAQSSAWPEVKASKMLVKFSTVRDPVVAIKVLLSNDLNSRLPLILEILKFQPLVDVTFDHDMLADAEDCGITARMAVIAKAAIRPLEINV